MNNQVPLTCTCSDSFPYKTFQEVAIDHKRWSTLYRCSVCGQYWNETTDETERQIFDTKLSMDEVLKLYGDPETKTSVHKKIRWKI